MDIERNRVTGICLRRLRKHAGLTQEQLGFCMSKTQSYVSKVENAERQMTLVEFLFYAKAVGGDRNSMLDEIDDSLNEVGLGTDNMPSVTDRWPEISAR